MQKPMTKINILNKDNIIIPDFFFFFFASGSNMAHHSTVFMSDFGVLFIVHFQHSF